MPRPKYPKTDKNHRIVIEALEILGKVEVDEARLRYTCRRKKEIIIALNISSLPGQIDWLVISSRGWFECFEVKEPDTDHLTIGEWEWMATMPLTIVHTVEEVLDCLNERRTG